MRSSSERLNWNLMLFYTVVLTIGIIVGAFMVAFYWSVDYIDRVKPGVASYTGEFSASIFPLSEAIIEAAQSAHQNNNQYQQDNDLTENTPTPTLEMTPTATPSLTPSGTPTVTDTQTATSTPSLTRTPSKTPTGITTWKVVTPTSAPKNTKPPELTPTEPRPTIPQPRPSATPQPTSPPRPSQTKDPYPYP